MLFRGITAAVVLMTISTPATAAQLFDDTAVLDVEIIGPLGTIIEHKTSKDERPFVLRANGVEHAVNVRTRGKSRIRVCDFPPLRIRFDADNTADTVFAGQTALKLVTQCQDHKEAAANVLEEFTAYRIFNLISDVSYQVRPLRIRYTDTDGKLESEMAEQVGFLIESRTAISDRTGLAPVSVTSVKRSSFDQQKVAEVYVFQYLIGNTDWSLVMADGDDECCHNGKLFEAEEGLYFVPYDFDLSGLVNARYAHPDPSIGIRNVRQRRYRGYCVPQEALMSAIRSIKDLSSDILQVSAEVPGASAKDVAESFKYLERFFSSAENEEKLLKSFERRCL